MSFMLVKSVFENWCLISDGLKQVSEKPQSAHAHLEVVRAKMDEIARLFCHS